MLEADFADGLLYVVFYGYSIYYGFQKFYFI